MTGATEYNLYYFRQILPDADDFSQLTEVLMNIKIIGAGAMGSLYAAMLGKKHDVTLIDNYAPVVDAINAHGLTLEESDGTKNVFKIKAEIGGTDDVPCDLAIVFVKDTATDAAVKTNLGIIGENTVVLSLQNGIGNEEVLARFVPRDRILLGTTKHNAVVTGIGEVYHSGSGATNVGSVVGNRATADKIVGAFKEAGIETNPVDNVNYLLWEKLFVNMTINPVTALLGTTISTLESDPNARALARALIDEAVVVAKAEGLTFDADKVFDALMETCRRVGSGKASMCQDIERGRRTEIDFINGAVVAAGKRRSVPTPCHETIVRLVHAKENLVCPVE